MNSADDTIHDTKTQVTSLIISEAKDNIQVTSRLSHRLVRLPNDPNRTLAELRIELPSCLGHRLPL